MLQEEATKFSAGSAEELVELGINLRSQGEIKAAIAAYQQAIKLKPDNPIAHNNLGAILQEQGEIKAAIAAYQQAADLAPELALAHYNLGAILLETKELTLAQAAFERAIFAEPEYVEAYYSLGTVLQGQGNTDAAIAAYQQAVELQPDYHYGRLGLVNAQIPIIHASSAEIETRRNNYRRELEQLANYYQSASEAERSAAATAVGWQQPFYLAYQGKCDRQLQQTYGTMIRQLMSSAYPQWSQPLAMPKLEKGDKIRVGFVSGFFNHHSVWKIPLQGWVENLDRSEFELYGYYTDSKRDRETARAAKAFDRFEHHAWSVAQWAEKIASDNLQVLIYPEFGMERLTLQLGCLRLAPVQLVFGGHPETSGLSTMDYHLTSDLMEPDNAQSHYTEELVRLPNLAVCYRLLPIQPVAKSKQDLGIQEDETMFWCCQSLFKYLPQHDDVFPRIAKKLSKAKFVFIQLKSEFATNIFRQRLAQAFEQFDLDYQDYCIFLPRLNSNEFNGTAAIADVFLDNIGWSGNNTAMESTAYNLPIVTFPGELMRGRHVLGILKMLEVEDTVAQSKAEYIDIAVRLGQDADYRQQIAQKIARNKHKLDGDLEPVRALENFLLQVVDKPRRFDNFEVAQAVQRGSQYQQSKNLRAAQQEYLQAIALQPDCEEAIYALGTIAQQTGNLAAAAQYYNHAVTVQPKLLKAWFSLGNLYYAQGNLELAEQAYTQALDLDPNSASICNNLGYVLQLQEKWSAAATYYQRALELMPNLTEAEANLGNALYAQGKLDQEQQHYYAQLNYRLGLNRQRVKDWQTASIYYDQAILMQPDLVDAHYHLGLARQQQRQLTEAIACYQQVLQLAPESGLAHYNLAQIYQDLGDLDQATAKFKQGLKLINPSYAQAIDSQIGNTASFADHFAQPTIPQGEITVGDYQFPLIPEVSQPKQPRPFWSVVIPVVNRPEYFPECLASLLAQWQGQAEMEIIVLDNGSNPPQWQIPDTLGRGIIRYYRFAETVSLQENWNTAVSLCRGEWIHLLHHDDYVLPGFYARFKAGLENCPESVGAAFTGYENINEKREVIFSQQYNLNNYRGVVVDWLNHLGVSCPLSPPSLVIRRTAYERLGGYKLDLPYTCDWEFYKRVATFCDWWYEPGILAHYREHAQSITIAENMNGSSGAAHRRAIEISQSYLPESQRETITAKSLDFHFIWCLRRAMTPLSAGNFEGAICLLKEALKMKNSPEAIANLARWLQQEAAANLVQQLAQLETNSDDQQQNILANLAQNVLGSQEYSHSGS